MTGVVTRIVSRLAWAIPLLVVVSFLSFLLVSLVPGDAAATILGPTATHEQMSSLRSQMGLDEPLLARYWHWLSSALHGDLGTSLVTGVPVTEYLTSTLQPTLSLVGLAVFVAAIVGMSLGVVSAARGGVLGRLVDILAIGGLAIPSYWFALLLMSIFAVKLQLLPAVGYVPITDSPVDWIRSLVLPVLAASLVVIAAVSKQTRDSMLDTLNRDFVRVMQANGLSRRSILYRHVLRNALIPVVTLLGVLVVASFGALVFVETVFAIPGLGSAATNAARSHDLPVLQGAVVFFTLIVIGVNLIVDLSYLLLDPRGREG